MITLDILAAAICQFARVLHVRDICCAYACSRLSTLLTAALKVFLGQLLTQGNRVKGRETLVPFRHEETRGSGRGGQLWGALTSPPSSTFIERVATSGAVPFKRVRGCARIALRNVRTCVLRAISQYGKYIVRTGTVIYLIITVPIDTILIINEL